ncbi:MAG: glycosyltransferase family 4 protein [Bryobacteraceae bacterium]
MQNMSTVASSEIVQSGAAARARIRVLLVAPSLDILGGQAVQATRILSGLANEPSIAIDFQPINPRFPALLRWLKRVPYIRTACSMMLYCCHMLFRVPHYDIVHCFSAGKSSFALWTVPALRISRLFGKKFILNYRDGQAEEHLEKYKDASDLLKKATVIISPSDYVVDVFARHGISARRIFNIIDVNRFTYRQRRKLRPVFMTNRILEPLYNVGCILRTFAIVQKHYPEANLTIAHDGMCRPELEQLARELGLNHTKFIGRVPHDKVPHLYDSADIYLTSPNIDCMPGSLLECFASGLPVVATKAGGIPYIVSHEQTGLLVDLNDHEAMAACCLRLLENPDLVERLTSRAREELDQYTWTPIRKQWVATYHELAGR